ncbi:MAG: hypothetical protein PHO34_01855 [Candidatus Omnitrophica bacterium]|jgi:hypothetical protein|nr:hypothetical protein [Candidatus Omnitrophota bacterium]MDD5500813.1 hypothetical protein [Candidatus Omnitrophota bacterium]
MRLFSFEALRTDCDNFFEGVLFQEELNKLQTHLKSALGEPVFPSKSRLPHKVQQAVNGFGGILPGQTLYYTNTGTDSILAMLWPWKDGQRTTIKIIQQGRNSN